MRQKEERKSEIPTTATAGREPAVPGKVSGTFTSTERGSDGEMQGYLG